MPGLKHGVLALSLILCGPAAADPPRDGLHLPDGLEQTLRDMMDQLKPALSEMFRLMEEFEDIDDPRHYQLPEVLPNGDIIIRRRPDAPPYQPRRETPPGRDETRT